MLNRNVRVIVFDLDGTLVDAYPAVVASVNHTLTMLQLKQKSFNTIKRAVGWGDRQLMEGFVGHLLANQATRIYRLHHAQALTRNIKFFPYVKTTLQGLKDKGYTLAICTNRPERFTQIILKTLGVQHLFDAVLCADKAQHPKPHPCMLLAIAKKFKISTQEMVFVGDMTIDIETGHRAGVKTIVVTTGSNSKSELKALKPWAIIDRIIELKREIIKVLPFS